MTTNDSSPSVSDSYEAPVSESSASPETPAPTPTSDDKAASPSGAQGESKESLLEAVMKVVKPTEDADKLKLPGDEAAPASDKPQLEAAGDDAPQEEELSDDPSPEEMGRYHSRTRKRIGKLLDERNALREQNQSLAAEAEVARGVRAYLQSNNISKEDFSILLDLGASLSRGDFDTFLAGIEPYQRLAEEATGRRLPQDLAQRVQQGHMTTDAARQFSRERSARQLAETNAERTRYVMENTQQEQRIAATQHAITNAVSGWEAQVRQHDPDYGMKQDAVKNLLWSVVREQGAPQSPEHAVAIANEAYRRANEMASRMAPKPRATAPVPSSIHRSTGATAEPKSFMEAAMLGLQRGRRTA
jgi:hypothetical protein